MTTHRSGQLPIRILKIWFDIVLALGVLAAIFLIGWIIISPFFMASGEWPSEAKVQVAIGVSSLVPVLPLKIEDRDPGSPPLVLEAQLLGAQGEIRLLSRDRTLHFAFFCGYALVLGAILYGVWILRKVLTNVLDDRPFDPVNGAFLRRCGYLVLALGALFPPYDFLLSRYALSLVEITNIDLRPAITFEKDVFVVGLLFLVFGLILKRGHELQQREQELEEEQALTV